MLYASNGFWKIGCTMRPKIEIRHARGVAAVDIAAVERDAAAARLHQSQDHPREGRLAAAGLADDGEDRWLGRQA
jgi:hypothetical protein